MHYWKWILLSLLISPSYGLEVQLVKQYYQVIPKSVESLHQDIAASIIDTQNLDQASAHFAVAGYKASVMIQKMVLHYENYRCYVKEFELVLKGNVLLPRLGMGNYPFKLKVAFENEQLRLEAHELEHEAIWRRLLKQYEREVLSLNVKDSESCDGLIDVINHQMEKKLEEIDQQNLLFDCVSYGDEMGLDECH